jgi:Molybdenum cofactor biosynthesis enzyme
MKTDIANENTFDKLVKLYPWLAQEGYLRQGRIHLPVSPTCNIQCTICKRGSGENKEGSGAHINLITPMEALEVLDKALELNSDINEVEIEGPGDTLATEYSLDALELINRKYPDINKILSTNGLLLKNYAKRIAKAGVKTLTVNINAVYADVLEKICSYIIYKGQVIYGKEGALTLILSQFSGIKEISEQGVHVEIKTMLIPEINDDHIEEIAKLTQEVGASSINIIPYTKQSETDIFKVPTEEQLTKARRAAAKYLKVVTE